MEQHRRARAIQPSLQPSNTRPSYLAREDKEPTPLKVPLPP